MAEVSIVIPFYNREAYLSEAICSVEVQHYTDWELLLVDDGSTDDSALIAGKFVANDPRISLYNLPAGKKGPSACRNFGAMKATGKYLVFLDSDDFFSKECIGKRVELMDKNSSLDFAVMNLNFFSDHQQERQQLMNINAENTLGFLKLFFSMQTPWGTPCPIWKRAYFLSTGGFDEDFLVKTDPELHSRVLLFHNPTYKYFREEPADCFYRIHDDAVKKKYIGHAAIHYRIKFFQKSLDAVNRQQVFPKDKLRSYLSDGILIFYLTYFINSAALYPAEYFSFLNWSRANRLLKRRIYFLLFWIGKAKKSNKKAYKDFRVAGALNALLKKFANRKNLLD